MEQASAPDLRKAMVSATTMMKAGIDFVPMPVLSAGDKAGLMTQMGERFDKLISISEQDEKEARHG